MVVLDESHVLPVLRSVVACSRRTEDKETPADSVPGLLSASTTGRKATGVP